MLLAAQNQRDIQRLEDKQDAAAREAKQGMAQIQQMLHQMQVSNSMTSLSSTRQVLRTSPMPTIPEQKPVVQHVVLAPATTQPLTVRPTSSQSQTGIATNACFDSVDCLSNLTEAENFRLSDNIIRLRNMGVPAYKGEDNQGIDLEQFLSSFEDNTWALNMKMESQRARLITGFLESTALAIYNGFGKEVKERYSTVKQRLRTSMGSTISDQTLTNCLQLFHAEANEKPVHVYQRLLDLVGSSFSDMGETTRGSVLAGYLQHAMPMVLRRKAARADLQGDPQKVLEWWNRENSAYELYDKPQQQQCAQQSAAGYQSITERPFQARTCYNCGETGHLKRNCPYAQTQQESNCAAEDYYDEADYWEQEAQCSSGFHYVLPPRQDDHCATDQQPDIQTVTNQHVSLVTPEIPWNRVFQGAAIDFIDGRYVISPDELPPGQQTRAKATVEHLERLWEASRA